MVAPVMLPFSTKVITVTSVTEDIMLKIMQIIHVMAVNVTHVIRRAV